MNNNILLQCKITETEKTVLCNLALGMKNREIADKMSISISTIKKHLESIYYKLSVHNRLQAIYVTFIQDDIELD